VVEYPEGVPSRRLFFRFRWRGTVTPTRYEPDGQGQFDQGTAERRSCKRFEEQQTGHVPKSVTVALNEDTLVITLRGALSPAEKAVAKRPTGAAEMQEFHRQLFGNSCHALRQEIRTITGVEVREATAEVETTTGAVMQLFATGTVVQVFLLARSVPGQTWSGSGPGNPS
jgi:uncharacterized protein YbcI